MAEKLDPNTIIDYIRKNPDKISLALRQEHRSFQQQVVGSIYSVLCDYAKHARINGFDLRNEAAVKFAKDATKGNPYSFPFI